MSFSTATNLTYANEADPNNVIVPYKVDTGRDGSTMPLNIYKNYFLK